MIPIKKPFAPFVLSQPALKDHLGNEKGLPKRPFVLSQPALKDHLGNEKGLLTLDFIFAFIIIFGFVGILFSFAMTFSVVETLQYVSFASARNYSLAHLNEERQKERADKKYNELTTSRALSALLSNGWFEISENPLISDYNDEYNPEASMDSNIFIGVRIPFKASILFKRIPLLGTTAGDPEGFTANIQSFLAREPTFKECQSFVSLRARLLKALNDYDSLRPNQAHNSMMDNGC